MILPPDPNWEPMYWTKPLNGYAFSRGEDITDFSAAFLTAPRGFRANQPLIFSKWQSWAMDVIFEEEENGFLRYNTFIMGLPRKNGKSLIGTAIALENLFSGDEGGQIYSAARNREQAKIVFDLARKAVEKNPFLQQVIKPYKNVLENKRTGSIYKAISADAQSAQGLGPSLVIADELHAWETGTNRAGEMWDALVEGSADRPESLVLGISTAGANEHDSLLGKLYQHGKKVVSGEIEDTSAGMIWYGVPEDSDPTDESLWYKANPNLAEGLMNLKSFKSSITLAQSTSFSGFERYHLNKWVSMAGEEFISSYYWNLLEVTPNTEESLPIPLGSRVTVGFDGSRTGDSTGLVLMEVDSVVGKPRTQVYRVWENTGEKDWVVSKDEVKQAIDEIFRDYECVMLWADDSFWQGDLIEWSKEYPERVMKIPQSNTRIVPLAQRFTKDVVAQNFMHYGEEALTRHVRNAILNEHGSYSKDKKNSKHKIDLLVCLVLAWSARNYFISREEAMNNASPGLFMR